MTFPKFEKFSKKFIFRRIFKRHDFRETLKISTLLTNFLRQIKIFLPFSKKKNQ